jgi:3-methyl-2-oxobutanoate hydroxymethyltransferase
VRKTIQDLQRCKQRGERFSMVTAYDYTAGQLVDLAEIPVILIGDSLGMVMLGHSSTVATTLDDIVHHARAVARGSQQALLVGDLPFLTYNNPDDALRSAGRLLQEAGVQAVKLEGGRPVLPCVQRLVEAGIPVMGHLGFTPQSVNLIGTRVQARRPVDAARLIRDALALQEAGAFAIVLELLPSQLAALLTERLRIPTIGIGAGPHCDGQVQVWHDLLGMFKDFVPRHTRRYAEIGKSMSEALRSYAADVRAGTFPAAEHSSIMKDEELQEALRLLDEGS